MEPDHPSSLKRTYPPSGSENDSLCHCLCQGDHSREHGPRGPKRQRPECSRREPTSPSDAPTVSVHSSSAVIPYTNFPIAHTETNSNINVLEDGYSTCPSGTHLGFEPYLGINQQLSEQHDVWIATETAGTSATYTATNGTLSPRSLNNQVLLDTDDCANQSQGGGSDQVFAGREELTFDLGNEWSWNASQNNLPTFSGLASFDMPFTPEPIPDVDSNALLLMGGFWETAHGAERSPLIPHAVFDAHPTEPWFYSHALDKEIGSPPNSDLPHKAEMSGEASQLTIPQTPKLQTILPSRESPTTATNLAWRNTTPGTKSLQPLAAHTPAMNPHPRPGVRKGPLKPANAKHAKAMRKRGACWPCRMVKVKCSFGDPCERCMKPSSPLSLPIPCYRVPLLYYTEEFFPELVTARLSEPAIAALIRGNVNFTDNEFEVEMSSGPNYPIIRLTATEFRPLNGDFLALDYVVPNKNTDDQCQTFTRSYAPPIGLHRIRPDDLRAVCLKHISSIINKERSVGETKNGDISIVSWKAFEAVNKYRRKNLENGNSTLLMKAVMLHSMHYFMSRIITFAKDSADKAIGRLRRPHSLPIQHRQVLTSTLLNLQIKQAMQELLRETTGEVLRGLEQAIGAPKTKDTWADSFCIVLILCMCIEAVQVASDSYAMATLRSNPASTLSRSGICRALDNKPFRQLTHLFHTAYKTARARANEKDSLGFNPIRHGLPVDVRHGITPQMNILVNEMKQIMAIHHDEMTDLVKNPSLDNATPDLLTHHMAFRKRNSGRLVSKFLRSFVEGV